MAAVNVFPYWNGGLSWLSMYFLLLACTFLITFITALLMKSGDMEVTTQSYLQQLSNCMYFFANGVFAIFITKKTAEIRKRLGDSNPDGSFVNDFICFWCCECCEIIQHARQIDGASGVRLNGCCNITSEQNQVPVVAGVIVGQPVVIDGQPSDDNE